jgi:hypothetical protein
MPNQTKMFCLVSAKEWKVRWLLNGLVEALPQLEGDVLDVHIGKGCYTVAAPPGTDSFTAEKIGETVDRFLLLARVGD